MGASCRRAVCITGLLLGWPTPGDARAAEDDFLRTKSGYAQLFATSFFGDGLRFNNPYRLATPLGSSAESISRTASYADVGGAVTVGDPLGLQHGLALRMSFALEGVSQAVMTPSYFIYRRWVSWALYGRAGAAVVLTPDVTWGFEGAVGTAWFVRGGLALAAEVVGDVFYGAGTRDVATPAYPVLSVELGPLVAWELLP